MATEKITRIEMPELDTAEQRAVLVLTTRKSGFSGQLVSGAGVRYVGEGFESYTICQDYSRTERTNQIRGTQANIDRQHSEAFTPEAIERIKEDARKHYAGKNAAA